MKKLMLVSAAVISVTAFGKIDWDTAGGKNVFVTNNVEYTRRGSMGTKDYVATDVATSNIIQRGYNTLGCDELDGDDSLYWNLPDDIWGSLETTNNPTTGNFEVKIPARYNDGTIVMDGTSKVYVPAAMHISDYGYEYLNTNTKTDIHTFGFRSLNSDCQMSNLPYCYGTNRNDKTAVDMLELPRGGKGETIQNNHLIFADRAWFTNFIIKAGLKTEAEVKTILESM